MTLISLERIVSSLPGFPLAVTAAYEKYAPEIFFGLDAPHLHLLTNHLPIFVTLSGLFVLAVGLFRKNRDLTQVALVLVFSGAIGGIVTLWLGQQSYKPIRGMADEIGQDWLDLHMERAEQVAWIFWVAGGAAVAAFAMGWKKLKSAPLAAAFAGLLGLATAGLSGWIADAGGKIRHDEVRKGDIPAAVEDHDEPHSH